MIRLPWTVDRANTTTRRRSVRPSMEGLEGRLLLSKKGDAAIARARFQASNRPDVPPLDTPIPTLSVQTSTESDPFQVGVVLSPKVKLFGGTSAGNGVVYLGRGPRGAFTTDTQARGDGTYDFNIVARPGDNLVRVFVSSSSNYGIPAQYSPVQPFRFILADPVVGWDAIAARSIANQGIEGPEAARDLATLHVAQYDAIASIRSPNDAIHSTVAAPRNASEAAAANAAAHSVLVNLFPQQKERLDQVLANARSGLPKTKATRDGLVVGGQVAAATLAWRAQNPTAPFVVTNPGQFTPAAPPTPGSAAFDAALAEVQAVGETTSPTRTDRQTLSAQFWADVVHTPTNPGIWSQAAELVAVQQRRSLWANARTFALLSTAMADAGTITEATKVATAVPRPQTVIRQTVPGWTSLLDTPETPSYNSAQAAYASAAAAVLESEFGPSTPITVSSSRLGSTRVYASASEAAKDAADSGVYGGVQYSFDVDAGTKLGSAVADNVLANFPRKR